MGMPAGGQDPVGVTRHLREQIKVVRKQTFEWVARDHVPLVRGERQPIDGVRFSHGGAKMLTPHLVTLSRQVVVVLQQLKVAAPGRDLLLPHIQRQHRPLSENTVNSALRRMGFDTRTQVCGHGFRTMACSALLESGLWSRDAVERQMSHQERNGVRAAYIHRAQHLEERRLMMQWWADFLDANRERPVTPYDFARQSHSPRRGQRHAPG